ncbi:TPA: TetR family transcriptional regulator [Enterococcus faecalis]|nr:TetR family transcriptional regulator [Enterococcus faecalis]HAP3556594.1 TetR family transcriptional regulator [Enterococcus faecalis]HAP3571020.1 TetR family transcriptional regulator [Enterococcus faecalis]
MSGTHDTKQAIASALIELCEQKDFRKISVQDITKKVGLNRQTFYYHFTDKYDLLRWIYRHDALIYLETDICLENWEEQALKLLKAIKEKSHFYYTTVTSDSEVLLNVFSASTNRLFISLFEQVDVENHLTDKDKQFYANFFSYGCSGVLTKWILEEYPQTPLEMATQLFRLAKDTEFMAYYLYEQEANE